MKNISTLIFAILISLTAKTQNNLNDTIENWTSDSEFKNYIGSRVYLPEFLDGKNKSLNWFNKPFLFSKEFTKIDILNNKDFQDILKEQVSSPTTSFNFLETNIYKPSIYSPISSYSKKLTNDKSVSNKFYTILDILSVSEIKELMDDWNSFINTNNVETKELVQKKRKWEKSEKSMIYDSQFFDERMGIMLACEKTKDTVYFIDFYRYKSWQPKDLFVKEFIFIPFIKQQRELYAGKTLVYNGDWSENENQRIISKKTKTEPRFMNTPHSEWLCEIVSFEVSPYTNNYSVAYQLKNSFGNTKVVFDLDDFISLETFQKQETNRIKEEELANKQASERKEKERTEYLSKEKQKLEQRLNKYIEKYGQEMGNLIAHNKLEIGMTKEMCQDSWDLPSNIKQLETEDKIYDVWNYLDIAKLYFVDNVLTSIKREL